MFELDFPVEVTETVYLIDLKRMVHGSWRASGHSTGDTDCLRNFGRSNMCLGSFTVETRCNRDQPMVKKSEPLHCNRMAVARRGCYLLTQALAIRIVNVQTVQPSTREDCDRIECMGLECLLVAAQSTSLSSDKLKKTIDVPHFDFAKKHDTMDFGLPYRRNYSMSNLLLPRLKSMFPLF